MANGKHYIKIPEITIRKIHLNTQKLKIFVNYTYQRKGVSPLGFFKNLGKGKIVYLDMAPIFKNLSENKELLLHIKWLGELLKKNVNINFFERDAFDRIFYVKNIGNITLKGKTYIKTPIVILDSLNKNMNFSTQNFVDLNHLTIKVDGNTTIFPTDSNKYVKLKLKGEILIKSDKYNKSLSLYFSRIKNTTLITRNPIISHNGTTIFDSLYAHYPYSFCFVGERVVVNGHTKFNIKLSGNNVLLLSDVQLKGIQRPISKFKSLNVDLHFFLKYPFESIFFTFVILISVIFIYKKTSKVAINT